MVFSSNNINSPDGADKPRELTKTDRPVHRPVTQRDDDGEKKQSFKDVLGEKLKEKEKLDEVVVADETSTEAESPLALAGKTKPKPSAKVEVSTTEVEGDTVKTKEIDTKGVTVTITSTKDETKNIELSQLKTKEPEVYEAVEKAVHGTKAKEVVVTVEKKPGMETEEVAVIKVKEVEVPDEMTEVVDTTKKVVETKTKTVADTETETETETETVVARPDVRGVEKAKSKDVERMVVSDTTETDDEVETTEGTKPVTVRQDDRTQINLAAGTQSGPEVGVGLSNATSKVSGENLKARETLEKLATEMIQKIEQVITTDRTDTTIRLQHPPLFEGAEITLTEFKTSQKEFNVNFTHLSPEARALIESKQNQETLRSSLIEKGYTLQMVTVDQKGMGFQTSDARGSFGGDARQGGEGRAKEEKQEGDKDSGR